MPRSSAIRSALINKLLADATLMALTPDGVFGDVAGASLVTGGTAKRFVIVSLVTAIDEWEFQRRAFEDGLYLVEARILSSSVAGALGKVHDAAERIDVLLDPQPPAAPATLTVAGYGLMELAREEPLEMTEFDEADASILWHRCGGHYRLQMSVT
jgi:hypothetical protein